MRYLLILGLLTIFPVQAKEVTTLFWQHPTLDSEKVVIAAENLVSTEAWCKTKTATSYSAANKVVILAPATAVLLSKLALVDGTNTCVLKNISKLLIKSVLTEVTSKNSASINIVKKGLIYTDYNVVPNPPGGLGLI